MKKAIVTGATSMIGLALVKLLIEKDLEVLLINRPNSKRLNNLPDSDNITLVEKDLSQLSTIENISSDCDVFFHLGWVGTSKEERNNPIIQESNIKYTLDALKLANDLGCKTFVGAGSQAEYGVTNQILTDSTPVNPITAYGVAKYSAGKLSRILAEEIGINHLWGRILSTYGPGDNDSTLIMSCINSLLNNKDFLTTEGEQLWDYIYCDDCASAFYSIAVKGKKGNTYCIGSGEVRPIKEYIKIMDSNIPSSATVLFGELDYSPNQLMYLQSDSSKLFNHTGFKPKTKFEDGIKKTIDWVKKVKM